WAVAEMEQRLQPVALLVPPGVVEMGRAHARAADQPATREGGGVPSRSVALEPRISRLAALGAALKPLGREPLVHANGYICRESFSLGDRPQNFYMIGSMGLASAIGLGLALARPHHRAVVFDGDGNLLMNLGILAQVGARRPANLVHCVFDNGVYGSTGNQASLSHHSGLSARIAEEAGFEGIWGSGLSISAAFGVRDNNELSWSQVTDHVAFMADATSIPILLDGDPGYGNFNNMRRLVRKLEQAGVA